MTDHVNSLTSDITELAEHIMKAPGGGDFRKERSKLGEKHHRTVDQINELLVEQLRQATSDVEYEELRRSVGGFLG
ncbi:MAG: hypothetical protein ABWX90_02075 [Candidatus Saccharimonadales bacterium]